MLYSLLYYHRLDIYLSIQSFLLSLTNVPFNPIIVCFLPQKSMFLPIISVDIDLFFDFLQTFVGS